MFYGGEKPTLGFVKGYNRPQCRRPGISPHVGIWSLGGNDADNIKIILVEPNIAPRNAQKSCHSEYNLIVSFLEKLMQVIEVVKA